MSDWPYINKHRVREGAFASEDDFGFNGAFRFILFGQKVKVIASDGMDWQHVSVSLHDKPEVAPSWKIMCAIKELFWEDEDWVVQYHPAKQENISNHNGCLHLWRPTKETFPIPPAIMVGIKGKNAEDIRTALG